MEKEILSLKNIYRLLTVNDYPVYSMSVIGQKNKKGLTLLKFWQENLIYEFRSLHYGRILWRSEGGRNRYISEICNRSERLQFYSEYTSEVLSVINQEIVLRQMIQFMNFLKERDYSFEHFMKRFLPLIQRFVNDDSCFTEGLSGFFRESAAREKEFSAYGTQGQLFFVAWHLTFLTICALTGNQMQIPEVEKHCTMPELDLLILWEKYNQRSEQKNADILWLTEKDGSFARDSLPKHRFFGREEELFNLCELVERGGKYLLSGKAGIGKTELLRQLLSHCLEEGLIEEVGIVPFEESIRQSFVKAFSMWECGTEEESFLNIIEQLKRRKDKKCLIIMDNITKTEKDMEEIIRSIPAVLMAASRYTHVPGFETYEIEELSVASGRLVFRDNYRRTLNEDEQRCLDEILENRDWCRASILRFMGELANKNQWSVAELKDYLEKNSSDDLDKRGCETQASL